MFDNSSMHIFVLSTWFYKYLENIKKNNGLKNLIRKKFFCKLFVFFVLKLLIKQLEASSIENYSLKDSNLFPFHNLINNNSFYRNKHFYRKFNSYLKNQYFNNKIRPFLHHSKHKKASEKSIYLPLKQAKTNSWSVLGDHDAEYALKSLESDHLTSAILHFIEITYEYSKITSNNSQQFNEFKKTKNKFFNSGSCVQVKLDPLRNLINENSFKKYNKQAETAIRTANLLTTLLSQSLINSNDIDKKFLVFNNNSNKLELDKQFFWSLLQVNLQSDLNLFANGIVFKPDENQLKKFSNQNDDENKELKNELFSPYVFRKKEKVNSKNSSSFNLFNYINLSALPSFNQRVVPNPKSNNTSTDIPESMKEKETNLKNLKNLLQNTNKPLIDIYSYSSDWYQVFSDYYSNNSNKNLTLIDYNNLKKTNYLITKVEQGYWTVPYSDCSATKTWLLSYSVPFFGLNKLRNKIEFKGVVLISIDLSSQDINQCSTEDTFFPKSHKCDRQTTECLPTKGLGFRRGAYLCQCKPGYYIPNFTYTSSFHKNDSINILSKRHFFNGSIIESAFVSTYIDPQHDPSLFPFHFQCLACPKDCSECNSNQSCKVNYTGLLRIIILGVQSFCVTIVIILAATTFRLRRSKSFASSRWLILEALLFGCLLLYINVIIQYFEPKPLNCFIEPWFRELGFGFCYGSIIIKLYRIYAEFQTRKAHRVCVRDKDLLKYLCSIILIIIGYMAAWSALILDTINGYSNLITQSAEIYILQVGKTANNLKFYICKQLSWDYVTQSGELSFVFAGVYLSYCIRNARSELYREKWALSTCIYIEFFISSFFYILRNFFWYNFHPDYIYLMYFLRCQLTVSVILILVFGPKIFFRHSQKISKSTQNKSRFFTGQQARDRVPEAMKLHAAILSNGEIDVSDINLSDMDPEDIRNELRRVYTQMQVLKNKTICKENPHISKRRGGRKSAHRRFSLQTFAHSKHIHKSMHHQHDHEQEITEVSRTPEESTASIDCQSVAYCEGQSSVLSSK
uniref:G-protein coupled receptor 3 n=1 Tax=Polyphagotarsonemus latus TaxID=1204166 RepID=A0AAN0LVY7_9ACAR